MEDLVIILSMLLFSAIFSGLEIAFVTADKMIIEVEKDKGKRISRILAEFASKPSRFIATLLIGNNLALVIYGIKMEDILPEGLTDFLGNPLLILLLQTIISTIIILIFAEYLPKALFRLKPNAMLRFFAYPLYAMYVGSKYIVEIFVNLSKSFLERFFNIDFEESPNMFGRIELEQYLENRTNSDDEEEIETEVQIYKNVLEFSNVKVKECMVPRTEIVALDVNTEIDVLIKTFVDTGLSKILVYRDSIDNIIGFVHHYEMFKSPKRIKNVLIPVGFIPSTMLAQEVLNAFIKQHKSVLVVVDEFGGTAGMVTVEDVMEEIFGEIEDEHDVQDHTELQVREGEYLFSGRLEIDYLNEKYHLEIPPSEDYETLAGFLFTQFESIPEHKEKYIGSQFEYVVEEVSETRIELVRMITLN